jgi:hypothetical protein
MWNTLKAPIYKTILRSLILITALFSISLSFSSTAEASLPTSTLTSNGQPAQIPNWSQITMKSLPPIQQDGAFSSTEDINQVAGYNLSRIWKAGQTADQYLKLGDLQASLYPQVFNLYSIARITNLDTSKIPLSALEAIQWQTIADLVTAIPGLSNTQIEQIPPIQLLLSKQQEIAPVTTFGTLLHDQLDQFAIASIPGLENIPLQNLKNWENSTIAGVPGLGDVPLAQMPNPFGTTGMIGIVDVVYGRKESNLTRTISGSHEAGFQSACTTNCAHLELTGDKALQGKQWISGKYQLVKGGFGVLGAANGGKEPTGRHPFGDVFKVTVWDVDEASGTASTALFFRICKRGFPDLGCTPYFLGPVPFLNYHEKEAIFTGLLDEQGGGTSSASVPEGVIETARSSGIPASTLPASDRVTSEGRVNSTALCGAGIGGVDFNTLADAFSSIEGNYDSVGSFVCDGDGNCGRGLGRYQYMSYRSDVRATISQQDGGIAFLTKADSGEPLSQAEVDRVFPPSTQDTIFRADQTRNIEQAQAEGFSGGRLIERVGQIHFGGAGAPIDGGASDANGQLTLKTYGEELRRDYESGVVSRGKRLQKTGRKS